nr:diaminopimelate decarboxylase [Sphingomonas caseinilyticus]
MAIGGLDVEVLCRTHGTPLYIFDEATFRSRCRAYRSALERHYAAESAVYYSGKSLLNIAVARLAAEEGLGIDVVSAGEMELARRAGVPAEQLHLHGNAKPRHEIAWSIEAGVGAIVADNLDELETIEAVAHELGRPIRVLLRFAPGVGAATHSHIQTGQQDSKFGLQPDQLPEALRLLATARWTSLVGIHCHLGSQIFDLEAYPVAIEIMLDLRAAIGRSLGSLLAEFSPGGGLGTAYVDSDPDVSIDSFVAMIASAVTKGCERRSMPLPKLFLEPGRSISARSMIAVYEVVARKDLANGTSTGEVSQYIHLDGGMADNLRPALYGASYHAAVVTRMDAPRDQRVHIAGRYCESSDILIRNIDMPAVAPGDLIAVPGTGAYTLAMASNYNWTCRPALLAIGSDGARLIQRRETIDDLLRREIEVRSDIPA